MSLPSVEIATPASPYRPVDPRAGDDVAVGELVGDAVLVLDAAGRVTYANGAAALLLGEESALTVLGEDAVRAFRREGLGSAALALHTAIGGARAGREAAFTVHDDRGRPTAEWRVAPRGAGALVVVRQAQNGPPPAPGTPDDAPPADDARPADALVAIARELVALDVEQALDQLAAGARSLLGADGACIVMLDDATHRETSPANADVASAQVANAHVANAHVANAHVASTYIAASAGSLAPLRGQRTELLDPPSPLHDALVGRRTIVAEFPALGTVPDGTNGASHRRGHIVVAPLVVESRVAAMLCAVTGARGGFSARDTALAQQLADHGALALRNHRLYETAQRSARDARMLAETAQVLARHVTPASLYPALAGVVRETLGACGFTAALVDPSSRRVERLYAEGSGAAIFGALSHDSFWQTRGGRVVREGTPCFVAGTLVDDPSTYDHALAHQLDGTEARALALLPLVADDTRGLLSLHFPQRRTFDDAERRLLVDFAAHVAVAVRNASLFVARERERDRAAAAAEIARVALAVTTLDAGAAAILSVLDRVVPSAGKALCVLREDDGALQCVAATGTAERLRGLRAPRTLAAAVCGGDVVVIPDLRAAVAPSLRAQIDAEAAVVVPLVARGRAIGDVAVTTPVGAPLDTHAVDALRQLAAPTALALDALLTAEERRRRLGEERRMTEQLRQAEKMAALGELVAGVAHEINNPLTGVSAFAELLLDDPLTGEQRESVRLIKREADRAVGVVRDLLAFSRKTEPRYEPLDVNVLVERTLRLRAYALRSAGIDVDVALDPTLPVVHGDDAKLQQVLLNLVLNAEHAMRASPARRLRASTRRGDHDRVVIAVADTGTGIAGDVLPRIFEPFFTTKPAGEGTGLGLSVSYGIVQAHGGELRVDSAPDAGTTMEVVLHATPCAAGTA